MSVAGRRRLLRYEKAAFKYAPVVIASVTALLINISARADAYLLKSYGLSNMAFPRSTTDLIVPIIGPAFLATLAAVLGSWLFTACYRAIQRSLSKDRGAIIALLDGSIVLLNKSARTAFLSLRITRARRWMRLRYLRSLRGVRARPLYQKQAAVIGLLLLPALIVIPASTGDVIGAWRVANAHWVVDAEGCSRECTSLVVDGVKRPIEGLIIFATSERLVLAQTGGRAAVVSADKVRSSATIRRPPRFDLTKVPLKWKVGWWLLRTFNWYWP